MPGKALSWSAVAVLISSGAAEVAAVAAAGLGVWATVKTGVTANRTAAASSLRRRLSIGGSPYVVDTLLRKGTKERRARQCASSAPLQLHEIPLLSPRELTSPSVKASLKG